MNTDKIYAEQLAAKAKMPATVFTYTLGVISALIFGTGMCLAMNVIGSGSAAMTTLGIIIGIIGMIGVSVNYPIYKKMLASGKQKYAFEIIQLAKEISDKQ